MAEPRNIMVPGWLIVDREITASAKLVYAKIVDRIGNNHSAWPGAGSLARDLGMGLATVKRAVDELTRAGFLVKESRGRGRSNSYRVVTNRYQNDTTTGADKAKKQAQNEPTQNDTTLKKQAQNEPPSSIKMIRDQYQNDTQNVTQECAPGKTNTGVVDAKMPETLPGLSTEGASTTNSGRRQDLVWDSVCQLFGLRALTQTDKTRIGRVVRDLRTKGRADGLDDEGTAKELAVRIERHRREWPKAEASPESLVKNWERFNGNGNHERIRRGRNLTVAADKYANQAIFA